MAWVPIAMMAVGTVVDAVGQVQQGKQMAAAEKFNASTALANIETTKQTAAFESTSLTQQSQFERDKIAREKVSMTSEQRVRFAKSGVRVDVGTPLDVMASTSAQFELDIAANKYNLETGLEEIRYERDVKTTRYGAEATYRSLLAKDYKRAGYAGATKTILKSGSKIAGMIE